MSSQWGCSAFLIFILLDEELHVVTFGIYLPTCIQKGKHMYRQYGGKSTATLYSLDQNEPIANIIRPMAIREPVPE